MRQRFVLRGVTFAFNITFIATLTAGSIFSGICNIHKTNLTNIPKTLEIDLLSLNIISTRDAAVITTNEAIRHYAPDGTLFSKVTVDNETLWESCGCYYSQLVIDDFISPEKTITVFVRSVYGSSGYIVFLNNDNKWNLIGDSFKDQIYNTESPNTVTVSTNQLDKQGNNSHATDGLKGVPKFMNKVCNLLTTHKGSKSTGDAGSQNGKLVDYTNLQISNSTDGTNDISDDVLINNGLSSECFQNNGSELATNLNINESNLGRLSHLANTINTVALDLYNPNFCEIDVSSPLNNTEPPSITINAHDNYVFNEIKDGQSPIWKSDKKFTYMIALYHHASIILAQFNVFGPNSIKTKYFTKKGKRWKPISRNKFEKLKGQIKGITANDTLNNYNIEININRKLTKYDNMIFETAGTPSMAIPIWQKAINLAKELFKNKHKASEIDKKPNDKPDPFLVRTAKPVLHLFSKVLVQDTIDEVISRFGDDFLKVLYDLTIVGCTIGGVFLLLLLLYIIRRIYKAKKPVS